MPPRRSAGPVPPIVHRALWNTEQTAEFLGLSAYTVAEMARKKQLPSHLIGRSRRFVPAEIERFVERASG